MMALAMVGDRTSHTVALSKRAFTANAKEEIPNTSPVVNECVDKPNVATEASAMGARGARENRTLLPLERLT